MENKHYLDNKKSIAYPTNKYKHNSYKYYYDGDFFDENLKEGVIVLSNGEKWNDKSDFKRFSKKCKYLRYGLCTSYSQRENVALWMLYGRTEKGVMLDIKKHALDDVLNNKATIELFNSKTKITYKTKKYKAYFQDAIYVYDNNKKGKYFIRHGNDIWRPYAKNKISNLIFYKDEAWHYENECRFVVAIKDPKISKNKRSKFDKLKIPVDYSFVECYHHPNYKGTNKKNFHKSKLKKDNVISWNIKVIEKKYDL